MVVNYNGKHKKTYTLLFLSSSHCRRTHLIQHEPNLNKEIEKHLSHTFLNEKIEKHLSQTFLNKEIETFTIHFPFNARVYTLHIHSTFHNSLKERERERERERENSVETRSKIIEDNRKLTTTTLIPVRMISGK